MLGTASAQTESETPKVTFTSGAVSEEPESDFVIEAGADLVSSYVWRGQYCSTAAFQPYAAASYKNLSLGAWGSMDFQGKYAKEIDFSLFYAPSCGFSVGVTDYFIGSDKYFNRRSQGGSHAFEGSVGYAHDCGFSVTWNTFFANDKNDEDDEQFSTYIGLGYEFGVKSVDCSVNVGVSPWEGQYSDKFHVADVTFTAQKNLDITPNFALGVFAQVIWSPSRNDAHFVAGLNF